MGAFIFASGLRKAFGAFEAVRGIDLNVAPGEVLGFLGPNGAGKSTTMRMLTGYLPPSAGRVAICGIDLDRDPVAARRRLGYLPEGAPVYPEMTVAEFLGFIARARGFGGQDARDRIGGAVERTELGDVLRQTIETLSKGFKRRVGLAQAILHDPEVLILDEPTDGLDPNQKHQVRGLIRSMAGHGRGVAAPPKAVILSTHILEEVEAVCTRVAVIDRGTKVFDGTAAALEALAPASAGDASASRLDAAFRAITSAESAASGSAASAFAASGIAASRVEA
ncbi:MAG TPA: ABC transporter ATP-binding protein [Phycisphaerales bacterium]|nr:ABC transporter ATP-binding protein [Phycisphaerales bacterium]HMP38665.1 ABC transporter ATP-binding protein [Phycisphaerales bacterium]